MLPTTSVNADKNELQQFTQGLILYQKVKRAE